jgi:hypothetical protein
VAITLEQIAQVELDHLARGRDPCPVEAQQLVVWEETWTVRASRIGRARGLNRIYRRDQRRTFGGE